MIDERAVEALAEIVRAGNTHQRACLIGGQALRDLYAALCVRIGPDIPAVRASQTIDLMIFIGANLEADRALASVLKATWDLKPGRPATYMWRRDPAIELDLLTTYDAQEPTAKAVKITVAGAGRIMAFRVIPAWLHELNVMEPCHGIELRRIGLERLRHTALLVSKIIAVDASLQALMQPDPPEWTKRLDKDLDDAIYLSDRRLQQSLWCAACTAKRDVFRDNLDPLFDRIQAAAYAPPAQLSAETASRLLTVSDGLPFWWPWRRSVRAAPR